MNKSLRRAAIDKVPVERLSKAVRSGLETRPTGKLRPAGRLIALVILAGWAAHVAAAEKTVTFTKDVAPILWQNCAGCHHSGHVGPFPLVTYHDAAKRADFIREITASGRMPPWRAEPGFGTFHGERRLAEAQLQVLARWAELGAPEGNPRDLPPMPNFPEGWQLGQPDLILLMAEPFTVPADGPDVYRCFVMSIPTDEDKVVAAVEVRPGNKRVVHHVSLFLDNKGQARKRDREDGKQGYTSFGGPGITPNGSLGGWGLANLPRFLPHGTGMPLSKGNDLVMQVHYHPIGKEETDHSSLGIYFAKKPVERYVTSFMLRNTDLYFAPGAKRQRETAESPPLPVDVQALSVTPHMHNLGREVKVIAKLPGGRVLPLVWIKDWDFNWHEVYQFPKPLPLPKGTVIHEEAFFDNTADNPKNPNAPPQAVRYGNNLTDEMLGCNLQVVIESIEDLRKIEAMRVNRTAAGKSK